MNKKMIVLALGLVVLNGFSYAQKKDEWKVDDPHGPSKTIEFETDEST